MLRAALNRKQLASQSAKQSSNRHGHDSDGAKRSSNRHGHDSDEDWKVKLGHGRVGGKFIYTQDRANDYQSLLEKLQSIQLCMDNQAVDVSGKESLKECVDAIAGLRSIPVATTKDMENAENMLRGINNGYFGFFPLQCGAC